MVQNEALILPARSERMHGAYSKHTIGQKLSYKYLVSDFELLTC